MLFLTFILAVITGIYAYLTYRILQANRSSVAAAQAQIKASTRPYVHFDLVPEGPLIEACLRNSGVTAAFNVIVTVSPQLHTTIRKESQASRLTGTTLALLSPGREIRELIGSWQEVSSIKEDLVFMVSVEYSDADGETHKMEYSIDLGGLSNMPYIGRPEIPKELKSIGESLSAIQKSLEAFFRDSKN